MKKVFATYWPQDGLFQMHQGQLGELGEVSVNENDVSIRFRHKINVY